METLVLLIGCLIETFLAKTLLKHKRPMQKRVHKWHTGFNRNKTSNGLHSFQVLSIGRPD